MDGGRGWEGKFLFLDVEGHIWHLRNIVTANGVLRAEGEKKECPSIEVWFYCSVFDSVKLYFIQHKATKI